MTSEFPVRFAWGGFFLTGALVSLLLLRAGRVSSFSFGLLSLIWLAFDLCGSNLAGLQAHPAAEIFGQGADTVLFLKELPRLGRIYSPSYSLPQQTAARSGLELADGIDPLQFRVYAEYMRPATGVYTQGYSVTLPAFVNGDPTSDNLLARPDARLLGLLNVTHVISAYPLAVTGLQEISRVSETFVYRNELAYPRAWVQPADQVPGQGAVEATELEWTPNHITVRATGPGRLILSEIDAPGWIAQIDGVDTILFNAILFRAVDLPEGNHTVDFIYRPVAFFIGAGVSGTAWTGLLIAWLAWRRRRS
jgi:hypothetical protein